MLCGAPTDTLRLSPLAPPEARRLTERFVDVIGTATIRREKSLPHRATVRDRSEVTFGSDQVTPGIADPYGTMVGMSHFVVTEWFCWV